MPPHRPPDDLAALVVRWRAGDRGALARLLTLAGQEGPRNKIVAELARQPSSRMTRVVAVTGSGGVGKSSLLGELTADLTRRGERVGILACDPESPRTGGALLGDRCRIATPAVSEKLFMRSLSAPCGNQGLAEHLGVRLDLMRGFGFDRVFVETAGAGQGDTAIGSLADLLVLVLQPQTGDDLQWEKAGLLEVADVVVVNKADLPGAEQMIADLREQLPVPVVATSVPRGEGIAALAAVLDALRSTGGRLPPG
jgi:LAO/AO transport system kinase